MKYTSLDGQLLKAMLLSGAYELENNKSMVNSLNVFPVPDGDTGTNMSATIMAAAAEVEKTKDLSLERIAGAAAMGSLMGARGNSGVILSQIMRGISKYLKGKDSVNTKDFALALKEGASTAYRAVMKPTEGTILTVARESAEKAVEISKTTADMEDFFAKVCSEAEISLNKTPELLPVLKQAGVVDAGGKGLLCIYSGMLKAIRGKSAVKGETVEEESKTESVEIDTANIKFAYCTEFFIKTDKISYEDFGREISGFGDSLVVVGDVGLVKAHIHTNNPGEVISKALSYGELLKIKIENMKEQHRNIIEEADKKEPEASEPEKKYGIITVSAGDGIADIFKDLGTDVVIEGGQTMNPSTQDIVKAINSVNAQNIFVLPNNSNIVMAAQQARDMSDKNVIVIPTKSIPQGITAVIAFNPEDETEANEKSMNESYKNVKTGQITYAVRDTNFNDVEIKAGNILAINNGKLVDAGENLEEITRKLIDNLVDEDSQLITILYGNGLKEDDTKELSEYLNQKYKDCDISIHYGGQPLYHYIISVE